MRSILIIAAIIVGTAIHQASVFSFMIKWLLAAMLFFSFLNLRISYKHIRLAHGYIAIANLTIGTLAFFIIKPFDIQLAYATSIIALAPTAIAAPAISGFLKLNVTWVAISTLLTNTIIASLLPWYIPHVYGIENDVNSWVLVQSMVTIFIIPFVLAQSILYFMPKIHSLFNRLKDATFILFLSNIFLASAKSSDYILFETTASITQLLLIALMSAIVCFVSFQAGLLLTKGKYRKEAEVALGQKNTMFAVWISITYINPLVSIAPMTYILFQNLYISYLMYQQKQEKKKEFHRIK